eukprot:CAMPEP_0114168778 /NCGR_PEP_ID=MMETSP0043_2-20121206/33187_1 /TAXON_ID=464988 /ORGANISM="Hemiselmis andersenii, Strain CCMP644" /LENGTH=52 /DNA_ID=CAMNT_0001266137 /DNA_START=196 /DNA_END=354 /DNA_ORIENTATION=+
MQTEWTAGLLNPRCAWDRICEASQWVAHGINQHCWVCLGGVAEEQAQGIAWR